MSLKKELQNKWHDLVHTLHGGAIDFFEALASSIEASGGQILWDAAKAAVEAAEAQGGGGEDKAKAALASVIAVLEKEGLPIVINAIKGAIEAAVANLKNV